MTTINMQSVSRFAMLAALVGPALAGSAIASPQAAAQANPHAISGPSSRVRIIESLGEPESADGGTRSFEIHVDNGKAVVKVDGKEVPAAQISEHDGKIIITDKDGKELKAIQLQLDGMDGGALVFSATGAGPGAFWTAETTDAAGVELAKPNVMIGVHMIEPGPALEHQLNLEPGKATMISGLYEGLPAQAAGLEEYDIIVKVDGKSPADGDTVRAALAAKNPGDEVKFSVIHGGKPKDITIKLIAYDEKAMSSAKLIGTGPQQDMLWATGLAQGNGQHDLQAPLASQLHSLYAPRIREFIHQAGPQIEKQLHEATQPGGAVDQQLDQLDKRLADLETLIRKMVDQQAKQP